MNLGTNEIKTSMQAGVLPTQMRVGNAKVWSDTRGVINIPSGWTKVDAA